MDGIATTSPTTVLRPPLHALDRLSEPFDDARMRVAHALGGLGDGWTVYVRPRVGLDRPDFVAAHDRYGICAIDVRGWLPHAVRRLDEGGFEFSTDGGGWTRASEHPRFEASRVRSTIFDQFYAMPEDGGSPTPEVRSIVVLPEFTSDQAAQLFGSVDIDEGERLVAVWGGEVLGDIGDAVRGLGCAPPRPASMAKFHEHVVTAETHTPSAPAPLTPQVAEVVENPLGLGVRRVRGSAGSGKTFALTTRAARLAAEGRDVLLLSFNVTMANRLRQLSADRCAEMGADATRITCSNFHSFCTRVVQDAEVSGLQLDAPSGVPWTVAIVAKVRSAFDQGFRRSYGAVLVDEGQDFSADWWNLLRTRVVGADGEMVIAVDPTQDLYGRSGWTRDAAQADTGFSGDWIELGATQRLPGDVVAFVSDFAGHHLGGTKALPVAEPGHVSGRATTSTSVRRWTNVERANDLGRAVGFEVVRMLRDNPSLRPTDVTFLCDYHHDGVAAARVIEQAGIPVHHIFSRDPDAPRRRRKHRYWPGAPAVKGSTVHSFKGWESPALVVGVGVDSRSKRVAYVSLTRLADPLDGRPSVVSVLNADRSLTSSAAVFEAGSAEPSRQAPPATTGAVATPASFAPDPVASFAPDPAAPFTPSPANALAAVVPSEETTAIGAPPFESSVPVTAPAAQADPDPFARPAPVPATDPFAAPAFASPPDTTVFSPQPSAGFDAPASVAPSAPAPSTFDSPPIVSPPLVDSLLSSAAANGVLTDTTWGSNPPSGGTAEPAGQAIPWDGVPNPSPSSAPHVSLAPTPDDDPFTPGPAVVHDPDRSPTETPVDACDSPAPSWSPPTVFAPPTLPPPTPAAPVATWAAPAPADAAS